MKPEQPQEFRHAVHGLHLATDPSVTTAWTELFRLGIRYARIARERAKQAENNQAEKTEEPTGTTQCV